MMEIEAGLCVLLRQGPYYDSWMSLKHSSLEESLMNTNWTTAQQPTLPRALYWIHTLHVFYNVPDRNGRAGK